MRTTVTIDDELMGELEAIKKNTKPDNIYLVVDAMMGQDAVRTALEFHGRLDIDGFIMTKLDGDARGGAALSIKEITGRPIKFLGMGEKMDALEEFRPAGLASRILGMGDVVGLVKEFEEHVDQDKAEKDAMRMLQGRFTLEDFLEQLRTIKKMGSVQSLLEKLPGMGELLPEGQKVDDKEFVKLEAMVCSMTKEERKKPELIERIRSGLYGGIDEQVLYGRWLWLLGAMAGPLAIPLARQANRDEPFVEVLEGRMPSLRDAVGTNRVAMGITPRTELAEQAGLPLDRGGVVDHSRLSR